MIFLKIFEGIMEVDETYLGGQKKNKRKSQLKKGKEVFEILARSGKVFAKFVDDVEAENLIPIIEKKVKKGAELLWHLASLYGIGYSGLPSPDS